MLLESAGGRRRLFIRDGAPPKARAGGIFSPPLAQVREVSAHIAAAVAQVVFDQGLAGVPRPADLLVHVRSQMYEPSYADYTQGRA